jgi:hypothetical protein
VVGMVVVVVVEVVVVLCDGGCLWDVLERVGAL